MKLFSESVKYSNTNSTPNILQVENFTEIFFDVFEIEINKTKYPVEKISTYKGNPVVSVPVVIGEEKHMCPFVLMKGSPEILFDESSIKSDYIFPEDDHSESETLEVNSIDELVSLKENIQWQIKKSKRDAKLYAEKIKSQKIKEANSEIKEKRTALQKMVSESRESLVQEFLRITENIKDDVFKYNGQNLDDLKVTVENKISTMTDDLLDSLKDDLSNFSMEFDSKIRESIHEMHNSIIAPKVDVEMDKISTEITEKLEDIDHNLKLKLKGKADLALLEKVEQDVDSVKQETIELNSTFNKNVNKALSRIGQVNTKVDDLTIALAESLDSKIEQVTREINDDYTEKLKLLEDQTHNITSEVKKYLTAVIEESRSNLIDEIQKIKQETPVQYVIESKKGNNIPKDWITLQKELDKKISDRIDRERLDLRRYVSVYASGGGTNAVQYANGGIMNGNLVITGTISASQYLGISATGSSPSTDTLDSVTTRGNTTTNSVKVSSLSTSGVYFDTNVVPNTNVEGYLRWNSTDGTLDLGMSNGEITQQIGQELFVKVKNESHYQTIYNGQVVYISGRTGVFPDVRLARSDLDSTSHVLGIATQDITSPGNGYITTTGYVRGLKTDYTGSGAWGTNWAEGDLLYVSKISAGWLTNVEPSSPHHSDIVGTVGVVSPTQGSIFVNINRHKTLKELTDVDGTPLSSTGQFPVWNESLSCFDFDYNITDYLKVSDSGFTLNDVTTNGNTTSNIINVSAVYVSSGSSTTPSYSFQNSGTTGIFSPANDTLSFATSGVTRITVLSTGQVGVGISTPSPSSSLTVYKNLTIDGEDGAFIDVNPGAESTGIKIGAVRSSSINYPGIWFGQSSPTTSNYSVLYGSTGNTSFNTPIATNMEFRVNDTTQMFLSANGNVGIGVTIPTSRLHVSGTTAAHMIKSDIGFDINIVPAPASLSGVVSAGGSLGTGAYYYGVTFTTALGETHVFYAIVTTTTGNNTVTLTIPTSPDPRVTGRKIYRTKVAQPLYAEYLRATIANNTDTTFVDTLADASLTGSSGVVYYKVNSTSQGITVGGTKSFTLDTKGIFIGSNAGKSLTTGGRNVYIGSEAGAASTTGIDNTVVGYQAAYVGAAFTGAAIFGAYAASGHTGGSNSAFGAYSLFSLTNGASNTALGRSALYNVTTGGSNIGIGSLAGNSLSSLAINQTPSNSIYIGNSTKALSSGQTNQIVIGDSAIGNGSNSVVLGNDSIVSTVLKGNVGIGISSPIAKLHTTSLAAAITEVSTNYTVLSTDYTVVATQPITVTLPPISNITGRLYNIKNLSTGSVTVSANGAELIDTANTWILAPTNNIPVQARATTGWIIL